MPFISLRMRLTSWLRRLRAAIENLSDDLLRSHATKPERSDALAGVRCVWYGRAMFCLYLPDPHAPVKEPFSAADEASESDLDARSKLDHAVVGKLEELDGAFRVAAHRSDKPLAPMHHPVALCRDDRVPADEMARAHRLDV